jgi:MFS family permease
MQFISYMAAWFSNVAIYTALIGFDVSAFVIALLAAFHFLPGVIQAPFTGALVDKFQPYTLMKLLIFIEIIATLFLLYAIAHEMIILIFLLVFIRMGAASFYFTIEMTLIPRVVKEDELSNANALHSMIWSLSYTLGMALSGVVVYFLGVWLAIVLDALLFVMVLIILLKTDIPTRTIEVSHHYLKLFFDGIRYLKKEPKVVHFMVLHALIGVTTFDAIIALMAKYHYATVLSIPLAIGFLNAMRALALMIGPVMIEKYLNNKNLVWLLFFQGVALIIWALIYENFYWSLVGTFLVGFVTTSLWSYTYTFIQTQTDQNFLGRVVSYNDMLFLSVAAGTSILIGVGLDMQLSIGWILGILGIVFLLASLYYQRIILKFLES